MERSLELGLDHFPELHPNVVACIYVRRMAGLPRVFAEWADAPILVIGTHWSAPTAGHVRRDGGAFRLEVNAHADA